MPQRQDQPANTEELPPEAVQRREVFARFGAAVYRAQCLERQIGILLATVLNPDSLKVSPEERDHFFDVEFRKTLGTLMRCLRERIHVPSDLDERLRKALELRNWLAHQYFWDRAFAILSQERYDAMITELQDAADYLGALDNELTGMTDEWLAKAGMSEETIQALIELGIQEDLAQSRCKPPESSSAGPANSSPS